MKKIHFLILLLLAPFLVFAQQNNKVDPSAIKLMDGYAVEVAVSGLSVPTTAIFDGNDMIVAESGFGDTAKPRILRITPEGKVSVIASEGLQAPVTGLLMVNGTLYVSHKTKVSKVEGEKLTDIITGLPSNGDHQNNNIVLGKDGRIYMGQGTVTNSAVVGEDNFAFGWLDKHPEVHDVPCKDISLVGKNFETANPLTEEKNDKATTGAYKPFGTPSSPGEVIKGDAKCNGAILSFNPDGSDLKVVSWGLRNPFGLSVAEDGSIWATFHGADVRGSRPIFNDSDYLVKVQDGAWYGWPEYFNGKPVTDASFNAPGSNKPTFLWQDHPTLTTPYLTFDSHAATNGFDFSPGGAFGFAGNAFIATFGSFLPVTTGPNVEFSGFDVLMVDMNTKKVTTFAENKIPGPSYMNRQGGFNRPSDAVFGPDGALYVIDWGGLTLAGEGLENQEQTGVIWRIYKANTQGPKYQNGRITVPADPIPDEEHKPLVRNSFTSFKDVLPNLWPIILIIAVVIFAASWFVKKIH